MDVLFEKNSLGRGSLKRVSIEKLSENIAPMVPL